MAKEPVKEEEVKGEIFKEKIPTVEALQFDGENGEDLVKFLGGEDFGAIAGKTVAFSEQGKDPRGVKTTIARGQWVVKTLTGTVVMNEGEFAGKYTKEDGSPIEALEPEELPEPTPEEELVYQPGFRPVTDEEKKAAKKEEKKSEKKEEEPKKEEHAFGHRR